MALRVDHLMVLPEWRAVAERVAFVPYDLSWPGLFEGFRSRLAEGLGDVALAIEHVGSTAVPGLAAKPMIDIDVVIPAAGQLGVAVERLEAMGYRHRGDQGVPGRETFARPPESSAHHPYVCVAGSEALGCSIPSGKMRARRWVTSARGRRVVAVQWSGFNRRVETCHGERGALPHCATDRLGVCPPQGRRGGGQVPGRQRVEQWTCQRDGLQGGQMPRLFEESRVRCEASR